MGDPVYKLLILKADGSKVNLGDAVMNEGSSLAVLAEEHAEIHRGMTYAGGKVKVDLGDGAKFYLIGQNNNLAQKSLHLTAAFAASGNTVVRTIGVTGRTGGSAVNSVNRKTGLIDSGVDAWWDTDPEDSSPVVVKEVFIPGGTGPHALGGQAALYAERIIPFGGWIGLEVENVSGQVLDYLSVEWDFYLEGG